MDSEVVKRYILIVIIVLINIILIILTSVSVVKSINKIARGDVQKSQTGLINNKSDRTIDEQEKIDYSPEEEEMSFNFTLQDLLQLKEYINTSNLQLCILIIIGINLLILAVLIYKKI